MKPEHDSQMTDLLDRLALAERAQPDKGFDARIAELARSGTHAAGESRKLLFPTLTRVAAVAALVAIAAVAVRLGTGPSAPVAEYVEVDLETASFSLFDETFGLDSDFGISVADPDEVAIDLDEYDTWFSEGDQL